MRMFSRLVGNEHSEGERAVAAHLILQQAGVCMDIMFALFALLHVLFPRHLGRHQLLIGSVPCFLSCAYERHERRTTAIAEAYICRSLALRH